MSKRNLAPPRLFRKIFPLFDQVHNVRIHNLNLEWSELNITTNAFSYLEYILCNTIIVLFLLGFMFLLHFGIYITFWYIFV